MGMKIRDEHSPTRPLTPETTHGKISFRSGVWQKLHHFFGRDHEHEHELDSPKTCPETFDWPEQQSTEAPRDVSPRRIGVGLPRQITFRRQNSEKRERLVEIEPCSAERRAISHSRQASLSLPKPRARSSPPPVNFASASALAVPRLGDSNIAVQQIRDVLPQDGPIPIQSHDVGSDPFHQYEFNPSTDNSISEQHAFDLNDIDRPPRPPSTTSSEGDDGEERMGLSDDEDEKAQINAELDNKWILNLSMHFRDKSDREKFFLTYAETLCKWRRVTVSCDYRNAEEGSLEKDLKELQFQRDKSLQIYQSIRDSLREIQFYDTVTNLKLETSDGRLHVHVTEDVNEIIPYPPRATVDNILNDEVYRPLEVRESEISFSAHLSGFVYKVEYQGTTYIKKEIPGPDTVDEFLYEINALHALWHSDYVIRLEGIVFDDSGQFVKGLLISYAERGAIVDLLYDHKGRIPWSDRLSWARDIVYGLSDIHEEGFVQGDFTLSNIVVDEEGNAKIIDINRRGCPVGWEPPEIARKIASHQRISMYIGEKTDIYQLGMTLWALAADEDEPERHDPPLSIHDLPDEIPDWYKRIVRICLESEPRDRCPAKKLRKMFPRESDLRRRSFDALPRGVQRYIDPANAIGLDDIQKLDSSYRKKRIASSPDSLRDDPTFTYPRSSNYDRRTDYSEYERPRGRQPAVNSGHLDPHERGPYSPRRSPSPSYDEDDANVLSISPGMEREYEEIDLDGKPFLVSRNTFSDADLQILERKISELQNHEIQPLVSNEKDQATEAHPHGLHDLTIGSPKDLVQRPRASNVTPRTSHAQLPRSTQEEPSTSDVPMPLSLSRNRRSPPRLDDPDESSARIRDWRESVSPQPPPSLPYADSGYDEPLNFGDPDAVGNLPLVVENGEPALPSTTPLAESSPILGNLTPQARKSDDSVVKLKDNLDDFVPPPLLRTDTSFKVNNNTASTPQAETKQFSPTGSAHPTQMSNADESPEAKHIAVAEPEHRTISAG